MSTTLSPATRNPAARNPAAGPTSHTRPPASRPHDAVDPPPLLDNRASYLSFGLAWLIGHGSFALTRGADPVLNLPGIIPAALLIGGLVAATIITVVKTTRAQRGVTGPAALVGNMLAGSWLVGFGALFVFITALAGTLDAPSLQGILWPAGSGFVVGMLYLAGGAANRDVVQYGLGSWLAVTSAAAVLLDGAGFYTALALAGGGGYLAGVALERRRLATATQSLDTSA